MVSQKRRLSGLMIFPILYESLQIYDSLLGAIDSGGYVGFKLNRRSIIVELNWIGRAKG